VPTGVVAREGPTTAARLERDLADLLAEPHLLHHHARRRRHLLKVAGRAFVQGPG